MATEGVMLQYAVDTKLDLCLSNVYEAVTKPPLPLNPYQRLLHILRAHAAKLDLFQARSPLVWCCSRLLQSMRVHKEPGLQGVSAAATVYSLSYTCSQTHKGRVHTQQFTQGHIDLVPCKSMFCFAGGHG